MSIIPQSLTQFPWRVLALLLAIAGFGALVLYSSAGGSIFPWAANQAVRFCIFTVMALVLSRIPVEVFARYTFPAYGAILVFLLYYIRFLGKHAWVKTISISVSVPVVCFFFFDIAMRIVLPKGYLEPLFIPLYDIFL